MPERLEPSKKKEAGATRREMVLGLITAIATYKSAHASTPSLKEDLKRDRAYEESRTQDQRYREAVQRHGKQMAAHFAFMDRNLDAFRTALAPEFTVEMADEISKTVDEYVLDRLESGDKDSLRVLIDSKTEDILRFIMNLLSEEGEPYDVTSKAIERAIAMLKSEAETSYANRARRKKR